MTPDLSDFKLPSPSPEGLQIMDMLSEVDVDLSILSDVIARDPVLAATIMKYANSPLYRRIIEVKSVRTAVNLLGLRNVATAILVATMRSFSSPPTKASEAIWEHSMGVSLFSQLIAQKVDKELAEQAHFLATIHDIGALTMAVNAPGYTDIFLSAYIYNRCLADVEKEKLGFTNIDLTVPALTQMKMPENYIRLLDRFHHRNCTLNPEKVEDRLIAILSLAHQLEAEVNDKTGVAETMHEDIETLMSLLKLDQEDIDDLIEEFNDLFNNSLL